MPARYGVGDHCLFMVDFLSSSLLGFAPKKIMRLQARRLSCKLPLSVKKYNKRLEEKILCHWLIERTGRVYTAGLLSKQTKKWLDRIDVESKQYMKYTEKKCQRILDAYPFSLESAKWIRWLQIPLRAGFHMRLGMQQRESLHATPASIPPPFSLSEADILALMKICQDHCSYFQTHGKLYRKKLLKDQAEQAQAIGDKEAEKQILGIIKQEQECAFWKRVKYVMKKQTGRSVRVVQVET